MERRFQKTSTKVTGGASCLVRDVFSLPPQAPLVRNVRFDLLQAYPFSVDRYRRLKINLRKKDHRRKGSICKKLDMHVQSGAGKYILFGHTHDALTKDLEEGNEYLNTGT